MITVLTLLITIFSTVQAPADPPGEKPRVIVMTDISTPSSEPDDAQSLVRFLLYANEFDVEGLLATTSVWRYRADDEIRPDLIRERVKAYGRVRENLKVHADDYPEEKDLLGLVRSGRRASGMEGVGSGKSTEASEHIISVVDRDDPRPVWVLVWGGAIDIAQALWDVKQNRSPAEVDAFVSKLRVYDLAGQDNAGAWAAHTFPEIFWLRNVRQFRGMSRRVNDSSWQEARGGNESVFSEKWIDRHIQSHGPLGRLYPDARYIHEGDTPTFLHLLPTGLAGPEQISYGNWGGRFLPDKQVNPDAVRPVDSQSRYEDYRMYTGASDTWTYGDTTYTDNLYAPLFRWRTAFQHDFAARMDWSVTPSYDDVNHNPVAAFRGDTTRAIIELSVEPGEAVNLSAAGSRDPDGDRLTYHWWHYREPGSYEGDIRLENARTERARFTAPDVNGPETVHVVLTVTDDGSPQLYGYRRIVITVE